MRKCQKLFCHNCWSWWCYSSFKFSIFVIFETYMNQVLACSDLNNMFLKYKSISKPEKSSLGYTDLGKIMILPRTNNGTVCHWIYLLSLPWWSRNFWRIAISAHIIQIYTNFANFARLYFP